MRILFVLFIGLVLNCAESFAAKKDFKGLFGSYRRDRFTENEGNSTDFGIDLMLSTMIPITPIVSSSEVRGQAGTPMQYATYFNSEIGAHLSLGYNWQLFGNVAYYTYDTRKENTVFTDPKLPLFHQFEMQIIPIIGGVKYRFSREDIVPYIGVGAGIAQITRKASYDYSNTVADPQKFTAVVAQAIVGIEFYIAPRAGIRLEAAATYFKIPQDFFDPGGNKFAIFTYQANPIGLRYASGMFILF